MNVWQSIYEVLSTPVGVAGFVTGFLLVSAWVTWLLWASVVGRDETPDEPFGGQWE